MLQITVPDREFWDDATERFVTIRGMTLQMEHSLVSISKWESKWHKPFLGMSEKTQEEVRDYYRCMTLTKNVPEDVYIAIDSHMESQIRAYIEDPMTASTVASVHKGGRQVITSELIYYWMTVFGIPFECQKWHLNRLLMLVSICSAKNTPSKKMSGYEAAMRNHSLNNARRNKYHSRG